MFRKVLLAAAATLIVGGASILAFDDASAQNRSGFTRGGGGGGMSRPSSVRFAGGGMNRESRRAGRPSSSRGWPGNHNRVNSTGGGHRRAGSRPTHSRIGSKPSHSRFGSRPSHHRFGSRPSHHRFGSRPSHHRFGSRPSHWRFGSRPSHWRFGSKPSHWRFGSRTHHRKWSWGVGVIPAAVGGAVYARPVSTAPVCYDCGGWTKDGCYMTWRKFVDVEGRAELRCVERCDEEPMAAPPPTEPRT